MRRSSGVEDGDGDARGGRRDGGRRTEEGGGRTEEGREEEDGQRVGGETTRDAKTAEEDRD